MRGLTVLSGLSETGRSRLVIVAVVLALAGGMASAHSTFDRSGHVDDRESRNGIGPASDNLDGSPSGLTFASASRLAAESGQSRWR